MSKYIAFNDSCRLHQLPEGGVIEVKSINDENNIFDFEYLDLNTSAFEACLNFDGTKTAEEVLKNMCEKYQCDIKEHISWYLKLVEDLYQKRLLEFTSYPNKVNVNISGNKNYISPVHATFEITHKCNLKCEHCYLESSPDVEDRLTFEEFKNIATQMYDNGVLTCEITGGEVFVHPQAKEILTFALNKFRKVGILTNGTLLKDDILNLLTSYKEKIIIGISLDSVYPEKHDEFRGKKNAHKQTCKNIKRLTDNGLFVRVGMSIYEDNMWEIDEMAELVRNLGVSAFAYNWIDDFGRGKDMDQLKLNKKGDISFAEFETNVVNKNKDIIPLVPIQKNKANNCGAGWRAVVMDPHGNVRPCALFPKDFSIGNLKTETYEQVFSKEIVKKLWEIQSPQKSELCNKECPLSGYCSGCYLKGLNANKNHRKSHCNWVKGQELEFMLEYV